jgi:hypothetical protein
MNKATLPQLPGPDGNPRSKAKNLIEPTAPFLCLLSVCLLLGVAACAQQPDTRLPWWRPRVPTFTVIDALNAGTVTPVRELLPRASTRRGRDRGQLLGLKQRVSTASCALRAAPSRSSTFQGRGLRRYLQGTSAAALNSAGDISGTYFRLEAMCLTASCAPPPA